ncbi:hypothetical protein V6N13_060161 [Hibiscus sabdariffa]|uniref:Uncharacterized protein n=1 Tax=Hibiscus sabdariffa TaxID=183260 RepID=A0ABR2GAX0_9ROSI
MYLSEKPPARDMIIEVTTNGDLPHHHPPPQHQQQMIQRHRRWKRGLRHSEIDKLRFRFKFGTWEFGREVEEIIILGGIKIGYSDTGAGIGSSRVEKLRLRGGNLGF